MSILIDLSDKEIEEIFVCVEELGEDYNRLSTKGKAALIYLETILKINI